MAAVDTSVSRIAEDVMPVGAVTINPPFPGPSLAGKFSRGRYEVGRVVEVVGVAGLEKWTPMGLLELSGSCRGGMDVCGCGKAREGK